MRPPFWSRIEEMLSWKSARPKISVTTALAGSQLNV
jgi:hypothetical protein